MNTCISAASLFSELKTRIETRQARIGVIGLGYVGLPLALLYTEAKFRVTGFDIDQRKVATLTSGGSYIQSNSTYRDPGRTLTRFLRDRRLFEPDRNGCHHHLCAHASGRISRA